MIRSFKGKFAQLILGERRTPKGFPSDLGGIARRKLVQLDAAAGLSDLMVPPGNRLESLKGDLRGHHSIRINDQWRVIFKWINGEPYEVRIVDYH